MLILIIFLEEELFIILKKINKNVIGHLIALYISSIFSTILFKDSYLPKSNIILSPSIGTKIRKRIALIIISSIIKALNLSLICEEFSILYKSLEALTIAYIPLAAAIKVKIFKTPTEISKSLPEITPTTISLA